MMNDQIILEHVGKKIRGRQILDDINLMLERGKIYCFSGRNGSGKTMLLRAIAGLISVEGRISVFGKEITRDHSFPDKMGLIIEKTEMWQQYTAMDNLRLLAQIQNSIGEEEIKQALERVGLDPDDKRHVKAYSMGMRQKLSIAQAVMEKPQLLLLDEPTNGLDDESVKRFRRILVEEKERGCTILVATHQMEDIAELCDKSFRVSEGRCRPEEGD